MRAPSGVFSADSLLFLCVCVYLKAWNPYAALRILNSPGQIDTLRRFTAPLLGKKKIIVDFLPKNVQRGLIISSCLVAVYVSPVSKIRRNVQIWTQMVVLFLTTKKNFYLSGSPKKENCVFFHLPAPYTQHT